MPDRNARIRAKNNRGTREDSLQILGSQYLRHFFGSTNEKIYLFAALCVEQTDSSLDEAEVLKTEEIQLEEFEKLVASGEFMYGAGLAAWARCQKVRLPFL